MLNEFIEHIKEVQNFVQKSVIKLDHEINILITNNNQSSQKIEYLLDTLLGCLDLGEGKEQFEKLNSYYKTFCPEFAKEYEKFYYERIKDI